MKSFWRYFIGFVAIIILVGGGFFVWNHYLSPGAKYQRQMEKQYQSYLKWEEQYKEAMRNDTYGGKTPEETLQMFIDALKKGDIELASKYFMLNTDEKSEYYLTRKEWENELKLAQQNGRIPSAIEFLSKAERNRDAQNTDEMVWFLIRDSDGDVIQHFYLKFNKDSGVWKIESL